MVLSCQPLLKRWITPSKSMARLASGLAVFDWSGMSEVPGSDEVPGSGASGAEVVDWSVFKGAFLTRATYLEGLELLRQKFTADNAVDFIKAIIANNARPKFPVPKELFMVSDIAIRHGRGDIQAIFEAMQDVRKTISH